jgi:hypothetical protein
MSIENLPLIDKDIGERMSTEIKLSYVRAYADAALHMPKHEEEQLSEKKRAKVDKVLENPRTRREAVEDVLAFAVSEFDGTPNEVLLNEAFHNLDMLVKARSGNGTLLPAQAEFIRDYAAKADQYRREIEDCVRQDAMPQECRLEHYSAALAVATTKAPRQSWMDMVEARRKAMTGAELQ